MAIGTKVVLRSSDHLSFQVDLQIAKLSAKVKGMLEGGGAVFEDGMQTVSLQARGEILALIIAWLQQYHQAGPQGLEDSSNQDYFEGMSKPSFAEFTVTAVDLLIMPLIKATLKHLGGTILDIMNVTGQDFPAFAPILQILSVLLGQLLNFIGQVPDDMFSHGQGQHGAFPPLPPFLSGDLMQVMQLVQQSGAFFPPPPAPQDQDPPE